jgi:probable F420-dependent oxidoreductase
VDRLGITIPFPGVALSEHRDWFADLRAAGYTDAWSAEVDGTDGFTPLALASAWEPDLRLGVAITPAFTRGPALLAQSVAAMAEAAPGRFAFGLGTSSDVIVEQWNGIPFEHPYRRVRDTLAFLRLALTGEKVTAEFETFSVRGFRLGRPPAVPPPVYLAALRPGMLRLAGKEADGVILNWLSADDVSTSLEEVRAGSREKGSGAGDAAGDAAGDGARAGEVVARIFVVPEPDTTLARATARRMIAAYLTVPAYAEFHRWLGRAPLLQPMWDAWAAGDRKAALGAIPDEVVDALVVHGDAEDCRVHVQRYVDGGVTLPVLMVVTAERDLRGAVLALGG